MTGWIFAAVLWILAFIFFWRFKKNGNAKNLSTNARWLFGILAFLYALDIWTTYFMVLWLGIAEELNPIYGRDLTLPMIVSAESGMLACVYCALKFFSTKKLIRNIFDTYAFMTLFIFFLFALQTVANNMFFIHEAIYYAMQSGCLR
jgi:hypothetical protein